MKQFRKVVSILTAALLFCQAGCGTESTAAEEEKPQSDLVTSQPEEEKTPETLMVYMVGSNLESEGGAATADLQEMALSGYDADEMNVVVCAGGSSYWWNSSVDAEQLSVYELKNEDLHRVYDMESQNMGDAPTLTEFMDYTYENYPAEHYSMIFWNHGGGAVIGYGADENYDYDLLSINELKEGLENSELEQDTKLEYIGFDACLMGMIEVADALQDQADYLIASEEVETGYGWDYSCLADITDQDAWAGAESGKAIINAYSAYYDSYGSYAPDYSLSCVDLSQVPAVVDSLEALVSTADDSLKAGGYSRIARCRGSAKTFGMVSPDSFYDYIDLYSLSAAMQEEFPAESEALASALQSAVVQNGSNIANAYGVSIYFPYDNKDYADAWVAAYEQNDFSSVYTSFIKDFTATLNGETLYTWNISEVVPEQGETASEYFIQLSEEEMANLSDAKASIWQADDEDTYICWINSRDITLSSTGVLASSFDGRIFYLTDDSGTSLPCCATEIERTEDYVKYAVPVIINMFSEDVRTAYIHVRVDEQNPDGVITGVYSVLDTDSSLYPDKNLIEIKEGDDIAPFLFARDIVFQDDQTVAPFEEWESSSGVGSDMVVTGDLRVELKANEDTESGYVCLFRITDTQGNRYFTNYLEMSADSFQ
jgi:hypothetical protein